MIPPPGGGKVAYQGPARLAMGWFASLGYLPQSNPTAPSQTSQSNPTAPSHTSRTTSSAGELALSARVVPSPSPSLARQKIAMTNVTDFLLDCTSGHIPRQRQGLGLGQVSDDGDDDGIDEGKPVVWHELWSQRGEAYVTEALQQEAQIQAQAQAQEGGEASRDSSLDECVASVGEYHGSHRYDPIPPPHAQMTMTPHVIPEGGGAKRDSMVWLCMTGHDMTHCNSLHYLEGAY